MAKYRQLYTEFWNDSFVLDLAPEEKCFYIYLLTNPNTSQCGIYELPKKIIEMQTGYKRETVDKLLKKFEEYKKIIYSEETKEIIILNWVKYNEPNNTNAIKCVNKELKKIKNRNFVKELYLQYSKIGLEVDKLFSDVKNSFFSEDKNIKVESFINDDERNQIENEKKQTENKLINIDRYDETEEKFIDRNRENKVKEENYKTRDSFMAIDEIEDTFIDIDKNHEIQDSYKNIDRSYKGSYKGLVSKEIISNKQEVTNNKEQVMSNSCCSNKEKESNNNMFENNNGEDNFKNRKDILYIFESNIHKVVPMEQQKIIDWSNKFKNDVIIMAIEEAIVNNIKNIGYIEKILNTWFSKGLTSPEDIRAHKAKWEEKKNRTKTKENSVDHWNYGSQREYDFESLERKLLGWETA